MVGTKVIAEFLDCLNMYDPDTCYRLYSEFDDDGSLKRIVECEEKCECDDEGIYGVTKEHDEFCRKNCVCIEWG